MKKKLDHLISKQGGRRRTSPNTYKGVLIGDDILEEMFGSQPPDVLVYGGIETNPKMTQFLRLPVKFKVFEKVTKLKEEV